MTALFSLLLVTLLYYILEIVICSICIVCLFICSSQTFTVIYRHSKWAGTARMSISYSTNSRPCTYMLSHQQKHNITTCKKWREVYKFNRPLNEWSELKSTKYPWDDFFYLRHCKIIDKFTLNLQYTCTSVAYAEPHVSTRTCYSPITTLCRFKCAVTDVCIIPSAVLQRYEVYMKSL